MNTLVSPERLIYLQKKRKREFWIHFTQITFLLLFLILWEILANLGILDSFITSQPSRILKTIFNYRENQLFYHIGITCIETLLGFSLGTLLRHSHRLFFVVVRFSF